MGEKHKRTVMSFITGGSGEAFCWGLFLNVFGVLIMAILWDQFTRSERPLFNAIWGWAVG